MKRVITTSDNFRNSKICGFNFFNAKKELPPIENFDSLMRTNANHARVWLAPIKDQNDYLISPEQLDRMELGVKLLQQRGMKAIIVVGLEDFRDSPWTSRRRLGFTRMWRSLAVRFKDNPGVAAFDLLNEPLPMEPGAETYGYSVKQMENVARDWRALAITVITSIRSVDKYRCIVYEVGLGADPSQFKSEPLPLSNIVYSFHFYHPHSFTHQNVQNWGGTLERPVPLSRADAAIIANSMTAIENALPGEAKYCGEFSAINIAANNDSTTYVSIVVDRLIKAGISWSYHDWRGWYGWDSEAVPNGLPGFTRSSTAPTVSVLTKACNRSLNVSNGNTDSYVSS